MKLSAAIVTHNSAGVLEACCRSVRELLPSAEIIVVDNASTDETQRICRGLDDVRLLANSTNAGFGRACNQGAAAARGSHVLFLNPDVEISRVDARALAAEVSTEPFGLLAPILEDGTRGGSIDEAWPRDLFRHVVGPLRPRELPASPGLLPRRGIWWPVGALLLVNREEFGRLGGFDPRFFLYYEDRDLARRYHAARLPVRTTQSVWARHRGGGSSAGDASGVATREGWSYLSWLEYLCTWNGRDTALRAARSARMLRHEVDRGLALLAHVGPASGRVARKRLELAELDRFVQWQSTFAEGTAAADYCPRARAIVSTL